MQRERLTDDIYVFTSDLYAQATASVVVTGIGAVLIDTLVYPEEARAIQHFVETRLNTQVTHVVNTHYHADHTTGTCFFPNAQVIAHQRCRTLLDTRGRKSLERAKGTSVDMRNVQIVLPTLMFESGILTLKIGRKTFRFWHTPGHSTDSIVCWCKEDNVLFAADTVMPIPYFADGSYDEFMTSLKSLQDKSYENVVQGHGEILLRGEVEAKIASDLQYLQTLRQRVDIALQKGTSVEQIDIEQCGKSRVLLNGTVQQLHKQNVLTLAAQRREISSLQP